MHISMTPLTITLPEGVFAGKAIAINPPWAVVIISGEKDIENRSWATNHRGPLAIYETRNGGGRGAVIGIVDLVDCVRSHSSPFFTGPFGWVLKSPRPIQPVPVRGMPGLFAVRIETRFLPAVPG